MTYYVVKAYKDYHYPFLIENEDRRNDYGEAFDKSVVFKGTKEECENIVTPVNLKIVELEKELNYQKQARSIAENAVVDLQQENSRLKEINTHTLSQLNLDNGELIIENEKLRKENAELKKKLKPENCLKLLAKEGYIKFTSDNLTKAKEIIKKYLAIGVGGKITQNYLDVTKEAEQFLSKVGK